MAAMSGVGTLNEKSLHRQLKDWCSLPGDEFEVPLGKYVIDIVRGDRLIEIQTRNFSAMRPKLNSLTATHHVTVVYPIAKTKSIVKLDDQRRPGAGRKSPKRGHIFDLFSELVYIPHLVERDNLVIEALLIEEEETRRFEETRARRRRRGWVTDDRRLLSVVESHRFETIGDLVALIGDVPDQFTTALLAESCGVNRRAAQQAAYCLRKMGAIELIGKEGNAHLYEVAPV